MRDLCRLILVVGVCGLSTAAYAQCTRDTDCKGDRVCDQGVCVDPDARSAELPPPPPPPRDEARRPARRTPAAEEPAEEDTLERQTILSVNVGGALVQLLGGALILPVELERAFSPYASFSLLGNVGTINTLGYSFLTVGGGAGLNYYLFGTAPSGFYLRAMGQLAFVTGAAGSGAAFGLLGGAGYQVVFPNGLALNGGLHLGPGFSGAGAFLQAVLQGAIGFAF
jgi:hypothetical protein